MRLRMKLRLGLAALLALVFVVLVIYLFAIPRIPTGYDEIARLRQAGLQAEAENAAAPAPARVVLSMPSHVSATPAHPVSSPSSNSPAAPPSSETPRQKFERCWAAVRAYVEDRWSPAHKTVYASLYNLFYDADASASSTVFTVSLSSAEWRDLGRFTSGTLDHRQALRRLVDPKLGAMAPLSSRPEMAHNSLLLAPGARAAKITKITATPPLPEATELLSLPAGAIPTLPVRREPDRSGCLVPILAQAYLYAISHNHAFDAATALRRLQELQHYQRVALYPDSLSYCDARLFDLLLRLLPSEPLGGTPRRAALAGAFARLRQDDLEWVKANAKEIRRYQAVMIHDDLTAAFDAALQHPFFNDNAFHFFLGGKPERIWSKVNAGNVRRHIELYAVAVATGGQAEKRKALESLRGIFKMVNADFKSQPLREHLGASADPLAQSLLVSSEQPLLFAVKTWWLAHGQLPATLADLPQDPLYESVAADPRTISWIAKIGGQLALVWVDADSFSSYGDEMEQLKAVAQDPQQFRAAVQRQYHDYVKKMGKQPGPFPPDAVLEKQRRRILEMTVRHSIRLHAIPLDFAFPNPQ